MIAGRADGGEVANPFKAELEAALAEVREPAETVAEALRRVRQVWRAGPWVGGTSEQFAVALNGCRFAESGAECIAQLRELAASQPDTVSPAAAQQWHLRAGAS